MSLGLFAIHSDLPKINEFVLSVKDRLGIRITVYLVYGKITPDSGNNCIYLPSGSTATKQYQSRVIFPINELRNLALQNTQTTHVICVDADMVVSCV